MRKIVYTRPDGGVSIVHPVISRDDVGMTEAQAEQRAWNSLPEDAISPRFVEEKDIPADRSDRNSWGADLKAKRG